jgi:hypothetical protein
MDESSIHGMHVHRLQHAIHQHHTHENVCKLVQVRIVLSDTNRRLGINNHQQATYQLVKRQAACPYISNQMQCMCQGPPCCRCCCHPTTVLVNGQLSHVHDRSHSAEQAVISPIIPQACTYMQHTADL